MVSFSVFFFLFFLLEKGRKEKDEVEKKGEEKKGVEFSVSADETSGQSPQHKREFDKETSRLPTYARTEKRSGRAAPKI